MKVLNFQERNEFLDEVVKACTIDGDYQPAPVSYTHLTLPTTSRV